MRLHSGEKPFACKFCKKSFAQKGGMLSHMRTHDRNNKDENSERISFGEELRKRESMRMEEVKGEQKSARGEQQDENNVTRLAEPKDENNVAVFAHGEGERIPE